MPRRKTIPDDHIFAVVRRLLADEGDKAVSFATIALATGLAPATLVQRYGNRDGMIRAAKLRGWEMLESRTQQAIADTTDKGAQALIKAIGPVDVGFVTRDLKDPALQQRAQDWRQLVETALAQRIGTGGKAKEAATILFALWQGQGIWCPAADAAGPTLKAALKRLT